MDKSLILLLLKQLFQKTNYPLIQKLFLPKLPEMGKIRKLNIHLLRKQEGLS